MSPGIGRQIGQEWATDFKAFPEGSCGRHALAISFINNLVELFFNGAERL
jgi:hypothetical protein